VALEIAGENVKRLTVGRRFITEDQVRVEHAALLALEHVTEDRDAATRAPARVAASLADELREIARTLGVPLRRGDALDAATFVTGVLVGTLHDALRRIPRQQLRAWRRKSRHRHPAWPGT